MIATFFEPSDEDYTSLAQRWLSISHLIKEDYGYELNQSMEDLAYLQKVIDDGSIEVRNRYATECLGLAFGRIIANNEEGMDWWAVEDDYGRDIAPARTFGFLKEVEMLRQRGLALGGSLENAIVLGETGVLNPLRFDDEFVRHKILDVVGDLSLVGHHIQGHLVVHRGGHALHTAFADEVLKQRDAWQFVDAAAAERQASGARVGVRQTAH